MLVFVLFFGGELDLLPVSEEIVYSLLVAYSVSINDVLTVADSISI